VGPICGLDAVVEKNIFRPSRESSYDSSFNQPVDALILTSPVWLLIGLNERHQVLLKRLYTSTRLKGVTSQNMVLFNYENSGSTEYCWQVREIEYQTSTWRGVLRNLILANYKKIVKCNFGEEEDGRKEISENETTLLQSCN
jgi:hypothetical protein